MRGTGDAGRRDHPRAASHARSAAAPCLLVGHRARTCAGAIALLLLSSCADLVPLSEEDAGKGGDGSTRWIGAVAIGGELRTIDLSIDPPPEGDFAVEPYRAVHGSLTDGSRALAIEGRLEGRRGTLDTAGPSGRLRAIVEGDLATGTFEDASARRGPAVLSASQGAIWCGRLDGAWPGGGDEAALAIVDTGGGSAAAVLAGSGSQRALLLGTSDGSRLTLRAFDLELSGTFGGETVQGTWRIGAEASGTFLASQGCP